MTVRLLNLRTYVIVAMFFLLAFGLSTMMTDKKAYAAGFVGTTYFEHSGSYWTISPTALGSHSLGGSVIPNYWGDKDAFGNQTGNGDASGAIGDEALGCYNRASRSWVPGCDRKLHLYNLLKWYATGNSNDWQKAGAAEVVNNMLDKPWGSGSRTITSGEWDDLYRRLVQNPNLTMEWRGGANGYPRRLNTAGVVITAGPGNGKYDSVRYDYGDDTPVDAWEFKYNGTSVMALEIACANGLGDVEGLPEYTPTYDLTPSVTGVSPDPVEAGSTLTVTSQVGNTGNVGSSGTHWEMTQIVIKPGEPDPSNSGGGSSNANTDPCEFFNKSASRCSKIGEGSSGYPIGTTPLGDVDSPSLDYPVGTRICYALSLQPRKTNVDEWQHSSATTCAVIGIKPKVQVLGADLMVGRAFAGQIAQASNVNTGITTKSGRTFGSWVEYGIFAPSGIAMASGSGLADPAGGSTTASDWNKLTFANVAPACPSSAYGCYNSTGTMGLIPDVAGRLMGSGSSALPGGTSITLDSLLNGLPDGTYVYTAGNANISVKGNVPKGKSVVIKTNGTVTIDGNITYDSGIISAIAAIPQLVLIGNVIQINENVDHVDSWLIAKSAGAQGTGGIVDTCNVGGYGASLRSGICNKVLTINGPIMAEKLWLRRTGGSGTGVDSGKPAEILNMRADAYLWALSRAQGNGRVQTVYMQEMAPRF